MIAHTHLLGELAAFWKPRGPVSVQARGPGPTAPVRNPTLTICDLGYFEHMHLFP